MPKPKSHNRTNIERKRFGSLSHPRTVRGPGHSFPAQREGTCAACGRRFGVFVQVMKRHGDHELVHQYCPVEEATAIHDSESERFPGAFTIRRRRSV